MNSKLIMIFMVFSQFIWADSFRLVTYNILSDDYIVNGLYDHVNEEILKWQSRRDKIVERIKNLDPDVICLQELNTTSFAYFKEALEDFEGFFAKKGSSSNDGVGTFCKKNAFKETRHKAVLCDGTSNCGCAPTQPALFTNLLLKNDKVITLVNTKIKWSKDKTPSGPQWNHVQFILKSIPQTATVVVGDFNMESDHPYMQNFYLAGLQDRFPNTYSCYANKNFQKIDYILSTNDLQNTPFESTSLSEAQPLPNENEPSDHLPVGSVITYE
ncbi:endonuclease/exonuclease/phosphatase family protein [bacterium]|nr:endonuclease/exonuclease/phosphatase family protein [bacterium]